jgi:hypothetical protein
MSSRFAFALLTPASLAGMCVWRTVDSGRSYTANGLQGTPTCWLAKQLSLCGFFTSGGLIIDEYKQ